MPEDKQRRPHAVPKPALAVPGAVTPDLRRDRRRWRALVESHGLIGRGVPLLVLAAVAAAVSVQEPAFLEPATLQSLAIAAAPILLLSIGSTLVILLGGFDLSVAAMASLASVLIAHWIPRFGWLGLLLVLVAAAGLGGAQGFIHAKTQTPSFIVTLGGLGVFSGLALHLSDASTMIIDDNVHVLEWLTRVTAGWPHSFLLALALLAALGLAMRYLPLGRSLFAIGAAEPAALLSGVQTVRIRIAAFALSALFAAIAGFVLAAETAFGSPTLADQFLLPAVTAVVVGGTAISGGVGGLWAALLGALIVTVVRVGTTVVGFDPAVEQVIFGAVIIAAVAVTTNRRKIGVVK